MSIFAPPRDRDAWNTIRGYVYQVVIHFLYKSLTPSSAAYRRIVLPFLWIYWSSTFERMRFRFQSPRLIETQLSEAQSLPSDRRAQTIFRAIAYGLDVSLPDNLEQWLNHCHSRLIGS
ncbi:hypothetical protein [Scytonema sp. NUACC26]|uniref:hypothetical protein n=1 Tax=Scytonema sp. NUACC26 TaxID=3140176 RepID=UPI0034DC3A90